MTSFTSKKAKGRSKTITTKKSKVPTLSVAITDTFTCEPRESSKEGESGR